MSEHKKIKIHANGVLEIIYFDALKDTDLPIESIRRVSHVEPDENGDWVADMSPSGGPKLGPFKTRQEALDREVEWLETIYMEQVEDEKIH